jgi:hypothetical protein
LLGHLASPEAAIAIDSIRLALITHVPFIISLYAMAVVAIKSGPIARLANVICDVLRHFFDQSTLAGDAEAVSAYV